MSIASTIEKYKQEYKKLGMTLETDVSNFIDEDHLDCLWYGGSFATIGYNDLIIAVSATGDVRIWGKLNGEDFYVKDKTNSGSFYSEAGQYLKDSDFSKVFSDESLSEAELENEDNVLFIDNNNWIEPLLYDSKGNLYDLFEAMDDTNVLLSLDDPNYFKKLFEYGEKNLGISNESDKTDDTEEIDFEYGEPDFINLDFFNENYNELEERQNKHSKTNKKGSQGWFTTLGGNPEVEKDFFNRATTINTSSESSDVGSGEGSGAAMGESVDNKQLKESNNFQMYKGYGIDYNLYGNGEYSVQYLGDDVMFDSEEEAKEFIDTLFVPDDDMGESFMRYQMM